MQRSADASNFTAFLKFLTFSGLLLKHIFPLADITSSALEQKVYVLD